MGRGKSKGGQGKRGEREKEWKGMSREGEDKGERKELLIRKWESEEKGSTVDEGR